MAIFPPRFILASWLSEATCLPLVTRMISVDVLSLRCTQFAAPSLDRTPGKLSAAWFSEGTQNPDLRPRDEVLEAACVDSLEC